MGVTVIGDPANRDSGRRRNLSAVLGSVHRAGQISRSALATSTGLNRSTVGALVADLMARGLVEEGEAVTTGSVGRPSWLVRPRRDGAVVLAADVRGAMITFAVGGLGGHLRDRVQLDQAPDRRTPEATVEDLVALVEGARGVPDQAQHVLGLGVAVPGIVRRQDGFVHLAANLGWRDVPMGDMLRERLGNALRVTMGNDAHLGAWAEHVRGAGVGVDNLVYVASAVGVGGGIIVDGRPLNGASGYAGEIGHIVVNPEGVECRCGARGCLETETGEWALLRAMGRSAVNEREAAEAVLREAAAGSPKALAALEGIGTYLGIGLAALVNVLNPTRLVLGGLFAKAHPYLADAMRHQMEIHAQRPNREAVMVVPATLEDSTLLGAVELALDPLLADPTIVPSGEPAEP